MRKLLGTAGFCLILALSACDSQNISQLIPGESSEQAVMERFGQPENVWEGENGEKIWEFNHQPAGHENYMITISADGKMKELRQVLTLPSFDKIEPGMAMESVRKMLGKPAKKVTYDLSKETEYRWRFLDGQESKFFVVTFTPDLMVKTTGFEVDEDKQSNK